ncbi:MAG TPA: archaetidylserine decarboxylase [Steroidobacteraceae bacterium]|nr:archaetidylserine decarboxylase [Steroidobacteraceae bacterium]
MRSDDTGARLFVGLQYLLPQHLLSGVVHWLARLHLKWVKDALIDNFVVNYRPDLSEAEEPDPRRYATFNAFFTRALRPGVRPIDPAPAALVSPVDGTVSQIGRTEGSSLVQAKGLTYTLESLLDEAAPAWAPVFRGGAFATLYLAPHNYHRIHMPLGGTLQAAWYVPGQLFSVNATTAAQVPGLFARNERVVCVFAQASLSFALGLVGALFVGSISTVWHGDVTPRSPRVRGALALDFVRAGLALEKGAEMGRFNMGSTVILLLPPGRCEWLGELATGSVIRVGQALARLT